MREMMITELSLNGNRPNWERLTHELADSRRQLDRLRSLVCHLMPLAERLLRRMHKELFQLRQEDWLLLDLYMEQHFPQFELRLRGLVPALSPQEYRLCALYRLGFKSNQKLAVMFGICPDSITKRKQRLKKHLLADRAFALRGDLEAFIGQL